VLLMSTTADELREEVRRRYAESAGAVTQGTGGDCGCGSGSCCADGESDATMFGGALYELRWVRGTHGGQFVADPQGTDER